MEPHASSEDQKHPFRAGEWRHRQQKPSGAFLLTAAEWPADPQKEQQPRHRLSDSENGTKAIFPRSPAESRRECGSAPGRRWCGRWRENRFPC